MSTRATMRLNACIACIEGGPSHLYARDARVHFHCSRCTAPRAKAASFFNRTDAKTQQQGG